MKPQSICSDQPYEGPFPVIHRDTKTFTILVKNKEQVVAIDRVKPAHLDSTATPPFPPPSHPLLPSLTTWLPLFPSQPQPSSVTSCALRLKNSPTRRYVRRPTQSGNLIGAAVACTAVGVSEESTSLRTSIVKK
ncbi:hypothetical protein ISCGN_011108 [Ixodes scapularis]